jgi:hypothetical protein
MLKALRQEVAEVLRLTSMIGGLSVLSVLIAFAIVSAGWP